MKKDLLKKSLAVFMATLMLLTFAACDDEDDDPKKKTEEPSGDYDGQLKGDITSDYTIKADSTYEMVGTVRVKSGATLTIEEGVTLKANTSGALTYLIIEQGGKINAVGTADKPITFTSDKEEGERSPSDWGGIAINGYATHCEGALTAEGEGDSGTYGGNKDDDNSGTLKYVRIFFAGYAFDPETELNGLALQGVGSGTTIDYIQIHKGKDDGIEMFGGKVDINHIVSTANGDDQIDATSGWRGAVKNAVAIGFSGDNCALEHDNNKGTPTATPRTTITYENLIAVSVGSGDDVAAHIRRGTIADFVNCYFAGDDLANDIFFADGNDTEVSFDSNTYFQNGGVATTDSPTINNSSSAATELDLAEFATLKAFNAAGGLDAIPASAMNVAWAKGWTEFPEN
ncbi:MAG TPA: hypothetical protein P5123_11080 [Spirochaetota bacterium]|mgnify:CR=1 FL=1|nr:hypothetical protein [Spirochaetota bacterium]